MLLKLLLRYLYWKTCIPHIVFFKFCVMGNYFFFTGLASGIFTGPKLAKQANKKPCYKKDKPYFKEIPLIRNVSDYSVVFFLFPRSTSTNINYDTTSQHAVRISVRM